MNAEELRSNLAHFTGTEGYTRHGLVGTFLMTDGAKYFADNAGGGCYWLMDILAITPAVQGLVMSRGIGFVTLKVVGSKAVLTVAEDTDIKPVFLKAIDFTDCPPGAWDLYLQAAEIDGPNQMVCMVPSEY
jgi:hypothetical protein